jgi:hypothetical protein
MEDKKWRIRNGGQEMEDKKWRTRNGGQEMEDKILEGSVRTGT